MNNYPPGAANDPNAPYNESSHNFDEVEVDVLVSMCLSKSTFIETDDYEYTEWSDSEIDDEGHIYTIGGRDYDFSNSNLKKAYKRNEFTIPEMLSILREYASDELETCEDNKRKKYLKSLIKSTEDWIIDEFEVIEDK